MAAPVWATNDVPTAADFNTWIQNINFVVKPTIQSVTSSTTLVADTALTLPVAANATYTVELVLGYDGATAGDIKVLLRCPTSATFNGYAHAFIVGMASQQDDQMAAMGENASLGWGCNGASNVMYGKVTGLLVTVGTAGNLSIEWAQVASSATATRVYANASWLKLIRVA